MSWYSSSWSHRAAVTVANTSGTATVDVSFTIPADFDHFWSNVLSSGNDIRMVDGDGKTGLTYNVTSFNKTNRTGTIEVDALALKNAAGMYQIWLYYGNAAASSGTAAVSIASAVTAYIDQGTPARAIVLTQETPGATRPRLSIAKSTADELYQWIDVSNYLEFRRRPYNGHRELDEVYGATIDVQTGGASQASMFETAAQRFVYYRGRSFVLAKFKAGTDATDYVVRVTVRTKRDAGDNTYKVVVGSFLLKVNNVDEA